MKRKKKELISFDEQYIVHFEYQNAEGYWRKGSEDVFVKISWEYYPNVDISSSKEKCNHDLAVLQFEKENPGKKVWKVEYA